MHRKNLRFNLRTLIKFERRNKLTATSDGHDWLKGLLAGASRAEVKIQGALTSPKGSAYQIAELVGATPHYNLYQCILPEREQYGILKITKTTEFNDELEREALMLSEMFDRAQEIDTANTEEFPYNYHFFFPNLVETFISEKQGSRRVMVVAFPHMIDSINQLTPLAHLREKEKIRIDPRTSVWILGKTLKVLIHGLSLGIANRQATGNNILIERDEHGLIVFDWSQSIRFIEEPVPQGIVTGVVAQAAMSVINALGGEFNKGQLFLPESEQLKDNRYERYLQRLAQGSIVSAEKAYDEFYELAFELWPKKFHPFAGYPL
jgi:hypothetical protein